MKKNVLQFTGSFHQGGSERQAVQLAKLLHEDGTHNIFLATLNRQGVLLDEAEKSGFREIPEFKLTSFYDINFARQLKKCSAFLRENKIDIVHSHDFYTNVFGMAAARLARVKLKIASKRETGGMRSKPQKIIENRMFKSSDRITVNSEAVKKFLIEQKIAPQKIKVIYNGLDLERLEPKAAARRKICAEFNLPAGDEIKFIALVANLRHAVKNQPMFLRAARRVSARFPNAHFIIAGEGELKNDLENLAREFNISQKTHFIGRCEKVGDLLSISFAGTLTSFAEGFSNSILEYMAANLPVVATRVGGASEAIIEGETGFLVESDDDESLAKRLIELLQNEKKAREMGKAGRKIVEEKFSSAAQLKNTLGLYAENLDEE